MPILIDTNVILDVLYCDPVWETWADHQINQWQGDLWITPIIYAELCYRPASKGDVDLVILDLKLHYHELSKHALFLAAKAYRTYRERGGTKTSPLPDFFIGAQAEAEGFTVLTRDATRYQTYFPSVPLICP